MMLHNDPSFKIYFGDAKDDCVKFDGQINNDYFKLKLEKFNLKNLVFLKQVHSNHGLCIDSSSFLDKRLILFEQEGDFIITNQRNVGIGVLTADCMPIVFYDKVHHVVAVAHVGWKGAVSGIVKNVVEKFKFCFNTNPAELIVYYGPSAKVCCYQVNSDFLKKSADYSLDQEFFLNKDGSFFLDIPKLVSRQLVAAGIFKKNINVDYNNCTICDLRFHSYRRSDQDAGRQATIVVLK